MITPVVIGDATLYCGRCEDVLHQIDGADVFVSDLPYQFRATGGGEFRKSRKGMDLIIEEGLDKGFDIEVLNMVARLNTKSHAVFFHYDQIFEICNFFQKLSNQNKLAEKEKLSASDGDWRNAMLAWQKTNPMPVANGHYQPELEYIWHCWDKNRFKVQGDNLAEKKRIWSGPVGRNDYGHPTQKPVELMVKIIKNVSVPGDVVLDTYMGTGTTGVACGYHGRRFIGIEKDPRWFDVAVRRCRQAFIKHSGEPPSQMLPDPTQENLEI